MASVLWLNIDVWKEEKAKHSKDHAHHVVGAGQFINRLLEVVVPGVGDLVDPRGGRGGSERRPTETFQHAGPVCA